MDEIARRFCPVHRILVQPITGAWTIQYDMSLKKYPNIRPGEEFKGY
jgi:hypothetical protein